MSEQTTFSPAMERFFEELAKTPREWCFIQDGRIRLRDESTEDEDCWMCPDIAVNDQWMDDAPRIWAAANNFPNHNPALRARLLECCGLSEVGNG